MGRDWETHTCARQGHVTHAPTEPWAIEALGAAHSAGQAWKCLRCGVFVPGAPHTTGPIGTAPRLVRGPALRDLYLMRLLALERGIRGTVIGLVGIAAWVLRAHQASLQSALNDGLPALKSVALKHGYDLEHSVLVRSAHSILGVGHNSLRWIALGLVGYAGLQLVEAYGLWRARRWGEYVAVVATSAFIPLELFELVSRPTPFKAVALAVNTAAVIWLVWRNRLFGFRGGHQALLIARQGESLLPVGPESRSTPVG